MSWRKESRRAERGYHHGNLKEALLQAALGLIAEKGPAGFTFADAARSAGLIQPRLAIPIHWGTLLPIGIAGRHRDRLGDPPHRFAEHVALLAPGVEVRILEPGEQTTL